MRIPAVIFIAGVFTAQACAAPFTVTWGAQNAGGALASADGSELPPGCLVRLGLFDQPLDHIHNLAWNVTALESHFSELARSRIGEFDGENFSIAGAFARRTTIELAPTAVFSEGQQVCVWVCNAPGLAAATEIGIFSSPDWLLYSGQFGAVIWDLSQVGSDGICVGSSGTKLSTTLGGPVQQLASLAVLADASDQDGDGVVRLLEEAFGMNAQAADPMLLPAAVLLDDHGTARPGFRYRRRIAGAALNPAIYESIGFRYTIEVSDDLNLWKVEPSACQEVAVTPLDGDMELVTLSAASDDSRRHRFFRVRVVRR